MPNIETTYLGLKLRNPLIAGSSGITGSLEKIKELEEAGIGAVVLKSIFEEQVQGEIGDLLVHSGPNAYTQEAEQYIEAYIRNNSIARHTELVRKVKQETSLPVIASVNCISSSEWTTFARDLEEAGADAIEVNVFHMPVDRKQDPAGIEKLYIDVLKAVKEKTGIPVSVKIGSHFTNVIHMAERLKANGASGVVMFNRFWEPDIQLDTLELGASEIFSSPSEYRNVLRWIGLVSSQVSHLDLAASTGIHDGPTVIKQLLAGAQSVQLSSVLYLHGAQVVTKMIGDIKDFMRKWNFTKIEDFRGRLSARNIPDPMMYERSQFMKFYSGRKATW